MSNRWKFRFALILIGIASMYVVLVEIGRAFLEFAKYSQTQEFQDTFFWILAITATSLVGLWGFVEIVRAGMRAQVREIREKDLREELERRHEAAVIRVGKKGEIVYDETIVEQLLEKIARADKEEYPLEWWDSFVKDHAHIKPIVVACLNPMKRAAKRLEKSKKSGLKNGDVVEFD